jgi:short subunit dehydrogenase-like uncharacterized protein
VSGQPRLLIYGATGYVGAAAAREAVARGMRPIIAARNAAALEPLARELGVESRAFALGDTVALDAALRECTAVLHCAGPFVHTYQPMLDACLRTGTHYLDLTGEMAVFQGVAARDAEARDRGVMLLPGAGFDVVPTDCLAVHLHRRLPTATQLTIAFRSRGPASLPPGTQRTVIEMLPQGVWFRRDGVLVRQRTAVHHAMADFGRGDTVVTRVTWGDVFTAWHSTGIANIETYMGVPAAARLGLRMVHPLRRLLGVRAVREFLKARVRPGADAVTRARVRTDVWARVADDAGRSATATLHGPEAGLDWTVDAALLIAARVLEGDAPAGYRTPASAYGPELVMACRGVTRRDVD